MEIVVDLTTIFLQSEAIIVCDPCGISTQLTFVNHQDPSQNPHPSGHPKPDRCKIKKALFRTNWIQRTLDILKVATGLGVHGASLG